MVAAGLVPVLAAAAEPTTSSGPGGNARPAAAQAPSLPAGGDARDAIARALEFTVTIEADGIYGAGIMVAPAAGLVLTAHHVVEPMRSPLVTFRDGRRLSGRIVESDRTLDLALVRVEPQASVAPSFGEVSSLRPGEEIYAVGCPRHLGFTVSRGIVSYVNRELDGARWLQTDLPINDGNSGGPVINARGELVGMMSFILRGAQGMSFALPVDVAVTRFRLLGQVGGGGPAAERSVDRLRPAVDRTPPRASRNAK